MVTTRWWWVRHAPVTENRGRIYGSTDPNANIDGGPEYQALHAILPDKARWVTSHLRRTTQTAHAVAEAGGRTISPQREPDLGEQDFGEWHGMDYRTLGKLAPMNEFWRKAATTPAPGGESFADLCARAGAVIRRLTSEWSGQDIVAVAHGGTIRAALGLALDLDPETALRFVVDNLSITRIDHCGSTDRHPESWQVVCMNRVPRLT